jgi:putative ABC transport system permease protein
MLKINLLLAIRNIFRKKLYTAINIIGLGVASAFCILVYLYLKNEQSFDKFHREGEQLFRLEETGALTTSKEKPDKSFFSFLIKDVGRDNMIVTPTILAVDLKRNFPEIENAVRFDGFYKPIIKVGNQNFQEKDNIATTDADFFKVFNYPLLKGDPNTVLSGHNQIVISERLSKKYFGNKDPMGKTAQLMIDSKPVLVTVSGLMKDFPANSSMQFDMIFPIESLPDYNDKLKDGVNTFREPLVLKLKKGTDINKFQQKLNVFAVSYFKSLKNLLKNDDPSAKKTDTYIYLRPLAAAHYSASGAWGYCTNLKNIYQLISLAVIILLIACFNYVLLTLTSTISKSQDVGVRKTIGAGRLQIVVQYYTETQLLAFMSVIGGFLLAVLIMPFFNKLTGAGISLNSFSFTDLFLLLVVLILSLGLLAGIYPAYAMSGLKPLNIMRGFSAYRINPLFAKGLIVIQFAVCVILILSSLIINKQIRYINHTEMGFDKEQVVVVQNPYEYADKLNSLRLKEALYHYVETEPTLQDVTGASFHFNAASTNGHNVNGQEIMVDLLNVDYNYFAFNKIPIIRGRDFSPNIAADSAKIELTKAQQAPVGTKLRHNVVVNQTLYNLLGKPALNEYNPTIGAVIIGVCKDYHNRDLTQAITPAYHVVNKEPIFYYWIRIKPNQSIPAVMDKLKSEYSRLTNNLPFNYTFMDEEVANSYEAFLRWMTTITVSCVIAIVIACLGLFGLSGLTTINRTKEIGIRKVLGASILNLFVLLNRSTIYLALLAFVVAAPLGWYFCNDWLQNFAYRVKPDWLLFTTAGIIAIATAAIAVSYHAINAARANPVESLRSE